MDMTRGLFRGKRTDNGEWVEGFYVHLIDPYKEREIHGIYTGLAESEAGTFYPEWFLIYPDTLGRYTGLTDKNGQMIFEGDIIRADWRGKKVAVVTFEDGMFKAHGLSLITWVAGPGYCPEAIGNIHDNPELMGGQDG